jgi:hypothetical protein
VVFLLFCFSFSFPFSDLYFFLSNSSTQNQRCNPFSFERSKLPTTSVSHFFDRSVFDLLPLLLLPPLIYFLIFVVIVSDPLAVSEQQKTQQKKKKKIRSPLHSPLFPNMSLSDTIDNFKWVEGVTPLSSWEYPTIACVLYFIIVYGGQYLMKDRKPFNLKYLIATHNLFLSFGSLVYTIFMFNEAQKMISVSDD